MPFSEVYPAMKSGLLDSMYTSSVSGVDAKAWEVLKYFTPINIVGPVNMVNVNRDAWNRLPEEIRNKVLAVAADMEKEMWALAADMDARSRKILEEHGMVVSEVSAEFRAELDEVGRRLRAEWARKAGPEARRVLEAYYQATGRK